MKKTILFLLTLFFSNENLVSQASEIPKSKKIDYSRAFETNLFQSYKLNFQNVFSATLFKRYYINTNLPNFENLNGMYLQKGYGSMTSVLYQVRLRNIYFSFEPNLVKRNNLALYLPKKTNSFSKLNDVPINNKEPLSRLTNVGFEFNFKNISFGKGNWSSWWGPGIHNSLVLSNNSEGITKNFLIYSGILNKSLAKYKIKYELSDAIRNSLGANFYTSTIFFDLQYKLLKLGFSNTLLSGGDPELKWNKENVINAQFNYNIGKDLDFFNSYYIMYVNERTGLEFFIELAYLKNKYSKINQKIYPGHNRASNIGLRKKGAFNSDFIIYGFEYTKLANSLYYNLTPSPNWFDDVRYDFMSYKGRRWSSHSGTDSDDFLLFFGYQNKFTSIIYGINYERHGINYNFPPEVKIESRFDINFHINKISFNIKYENEYFEHYGFVDNNLNVWNETFERGSIQRTNTFLFSIIYKLISV